MVAWPDLAFVDVVLYAILERGPAGRSERLVLRRAVFVDQPDGTEVAVEQLWTTSAYRSAMDALAVVRRLDAVAERLLLGRPVEMLPDWQPIGPNDVEELVDTVRRSGADVERLVGYRGAVRAVQDGGRLVRADVVSSTGGILTRPAHLIVTNALRDLLPMSDGSAGPTDEPEPADDQERLSAAGALLVDLDDARVAFAQRDRWEEITHGRLVTVDPHDRKLSGVDGVEEPVYTRWQRVTADGVALTAGAGRDPERDSVVVTLIGVDGAQVGDHNLQVNRFRCQVDPQIDLRALWHDRSVQTALAEFAASRGDPEKRQAAVDALCEAGERGHTTWTPAEEHRVRLGGDGSVHTRLAGTVVLSDCRGVQIGDHVRQYNTFTSTISPDVKTGELLREHPEVVESIVDFACQTDATGRRDVERALNAAVCGDASGPLLREPGSGTLPWATFRRTDEIALSIGAHNRVQDDLDVTAAISRSITRALDAEQRSVDAQRRLIERDQREALERIELERTAEVARQAQLARLEDEARLARAQHDLAAREYRAPAQPHYRSGPSIGI